MVNLTLCNVTISQILLSLSVIKFFTRKYTTVEKVFSAISPGWKKILVAIILFDGLVVAVGAYLLVATDIFAAPPIPTIVVGPPPTDTATPWAGPPGGTSTATPIMPPTPLATTILAQSGFPHGFTPTPRPTPEPVYISLPMLYIVGRNARDVPVVYQVLYPESFFAPGTNNACGPVALYAGLLGLGLDIDYQRVRDLAVSYGFDASGFSTSGMVNTATTISNERNEPFSVEQGRTFTTQDLIRHLRRGEVVVVLLQVKQGNSGFQVSGYEAGSFGHFLIVERINIRTRKVRFAGSTLGMDEVPLGDFVASWSNNSQALAPPEGWRAYLDNEQPGGWAMMLKPNR
jgi:hypothetical protein